MHEVVGVHQRLWNGIKRQGTVLKNKMVEGILTCTQDLNHWNGWQCISINIIWNQLIKKEQSMNLGLNKNMDLKIRGLVRLALFTERSQLKLMNQENAILRVRKQRHWKRGLWEKYTLRTRFDILNCNEYSKKAEEYSGWNVLQQQRCTN